MRTSFGECGDAGNCNCCCCCCCNDSGMRTCIKLSIVFGCDFTISSGTPDAAKIFCHSSGSPMNPLPSVSTCTCMLCWKLYGFPMTEGDLVTVWECVLVLTGGGTRFGLINWVSSMSSLGKEDCCHTSGSPYTNQVRKPGSLIASVSIKLDRTMNLPFSLLYST